MMLQSLIVEATAMLHEAAERSSPDNWPEAVVTIVVAVLSWWLGREREKRKR